MKLLIVIGTRPEAIKMAGLVAALRRRPGVEWRVCATGQHGTMLDETMAELGLVADVNLGIMKSASGLPAITAAALLGLGPVIESFKPDWVLVQGDTTTAMAASIAAFYQKVPVAHVEAGLRTWDRYSPWPEEVNRKIVGAVAAKHFAPTETARANLLAEGVPAEDVVVTGNTVIDALLAMRERTRTEPALAQALKAEFAFLDPERPFILVTGHRRESFGDGFRQICLALREIARRGDVDVVYPVHLNPNVRAPVSELLSGEPHVHLLEPLGYSRFVHLMDRARILLTDSGGVQEEGPSLGKPILVMRDTSERPEAISAGSARLVGARADSIVAAVDELMSDPAAYAAMARPRHVYGDGLASERILAVLEGRSELRPAVDEAA